MLGPPLPDILDLFASYTVWGRESLQNLFNLKVIQRYPGTAARRTRKLALPVDRQGSSESTSFQASFTFQ